MYSGSCANSEAWHHDDCVSNHNARNSRLDSKKYYRSLGVKEHFYGHQAANESSDVRCW